MTDEQRAHDIAVASLKIIYEIRTLNLSGTEPILFNPYEEYKVLYALTLDSIKNDKK